MSNKKNQFYLKPSTAVLLLRYWKSASDFWRGRSGLKAWALLGLLVVLILLQLLIQYLINFWNRDFFNALNEKNVSLVWNQAKLFVPLAVGSVSIAIFSVWAKMTLQRKWRQWLSKYLIHYWLKNDYYCRLRVTNAEYRIAEDARVATDLPIDLILGFLSSVLTGLAFVSILWEIGGSLNFNIGGFAFSLPGYLVISAISYSFLLTSLMFLIGQHLTDAVEGKNHSEAEFRAASSRLREHGKNRVDPSNIRNERKRNIEFEGHEQKKKLKM
ncbi:MAG: hypothetical protein H0T62_03340 [Parachlamydiaceae bacterium]|nr:hypothetical protein [Parachlamydiaceae bacterium]